MLQVFKWLWSKAQKYGEDRVLDMIKEQAQYHQLMCETAHLKSKYEPWDGVKPKGFINSADYSAKEHSLMAQALFKVCKDYYKSKEGRYDGR